ncbi:HugZ family pyridoxamine 5'-phosphate oxidase [Paraclostridium sordellii]|uniref:HugZ family pyridoxamine 5'-phosphate oxidase n=1 Tax=Paraclostridium sordellii TaxID=1505 RepID=UPI0005E30FDE|nr:pyridoxamine 5'-phosphate oxidase family protein [Paeniclostridium sordellii]CEO25521.1 pyridoxamine 5'-phosphate oxidase-related FMN-binding protein [[Clostridium] sordellii] [Paeniclostridium sordellii]CEP44681.1 pyridoxamine 5'-phosphate oxidase-related FMN-binding protein [[Clostridium] sordellii] [Paeniclostridium sordellii]
MQNLLNTQKSLMISSLSKENQPEISYAPFIMKDNNLYIYISKTASHYQNLIDNSNCSVIVIEDESTCKTVFARQRVSFSCEASILKENVEVVFEEFENVHGSQMMMVLKNLDFDIFKLDIKKGRLVKGFGQAFDILVKDGEFELNQVVGDGHK